MRIRRKKWTQSEIDTNARLVVPYGANKGRWHTYFGNDNEIHVEIGCGKGRFVTQTAALCPDINFVALERSEQVIAAGMRASRALDPKPAFVICDVDVIQDVFAAGELSRIYINFCDPWPRPRWHKRRLTHQGYLERYKTLLAPGGGVFFKTDDRPLFDFSLASFAQNGWRLAHVTRDLHQGGQAEGIMTEYEEKFFLRGMPIYRCEAYI